MKKFLSALLCATCLLATLASCSNGAGQTPDGSQASGSGSDGTVQAIGLGNQTGGSSDVNAPTDPVDVEAPKMTGMERAKTMLAKMEDGESNLLFSPASLEMALGLLSEGAGGATRNQLLGYLGHDSYSDVAERLLERADEVTVGQSGDDNLELLMGYKTALRMANSLWVNNKYTLKDEYLKTAEESYRATSQALDFGNPEESAKAINDWCDETTDGLIKEIVSPDTIVRDLALILCNSLYFESAWNEPWNVEEGEFTGADGITKTVPEFLSRTEDLYYETDNAVAFGKRYINGSTFVGILPNEGVTLADIDLDALIASKSTDYDVRASMPKLNYEFTSNALIPILQSLGVEDVFTAGADLSGIVKESDELFVSDIIQKCKIELDENGTKAAAVTMIAMKDNAIFIEEPPEIKEVHLNRPFYYLIMDEIAGQVWFIGSVNSVD